MASVLEEVLSAYFDNTIPEVFLELLLRNGAPAEVAQHIQTSSAPQDNAGLLERCFQALRRGALNGPGIDGDDPEEQGRQRRMERAVAALFKAAMAVLTSDAEDSQLGAYPSILLDNLDLLTFQQLAALLSDICRAVEGGSAGTPRLLQLLPKTATQLLEAGAPEDEAEEDDGAEGEGAGGRGASAAGAAAARHVDAALHRLTHADWVSERGNFAVQIMEALRDVPMTAQQLRSVVAKALSVCGGCTDLAALPSLLRQLMRLAGLGQRALVLRGVLALFERLEVQHRGPDGRGPSQVLQNVEGTALVIIADAFKYDSALAEELLKSVRSSAGAPSPFCLLLLFTLSRQHKLDSQVVALLRALVVAAFEWDATRGRSAWLSSLPQLPRPAGHQLRAALLRAVRYSGVGGEVVVPGILALGAVLMGGCPAAEALALVQRNDAALAEAEAEAAAAAAARRAQKRQQQHLPPQPPPPRGPGGGAGAGAAAAAAAAESAALPRGSVALQSALLGVELLQAAFEAHREARPDVLRLCQGALGGAAGGVGAGGGGLGGGGGLNLGLGGAGGGGGGGGSGQELLALPAVLLLSNLVARHSALLYEHANRIKDAFQSFLLLPAPVALGLLLGVWPLARGRRDLADYLVMLLRKVMFAREAASRLVAVRGFLFILLQQLRAAAGPAAAEDEEQLRAAAAAAAAAAGPSFSQASCSQSSLSQMQALASGAGVSLQHELQGFLRRALGQQAAVRAALYDGLSEILLVDPGSRDVVLELVAPQFYRYVADGAAMPPFHCRMLTGGGTSGNDPVLLLEPLPALLACVRRLVALCRDPRVSDGGGDALGLLADVDGGEGGDVVMMEDDEADGDGEEAGPQGQRADLAVRNLIRGWDSFARRLLRCEAEHFDLNCSAELNPATTSGAARQLQAACILGAVEVVMEELVAIATGPRGPETAARTGERLSRAFELHCRVYDMAREAKSQGGSKAKQSATEAAAGSGGDGSAGGNATAATAAMMGTAPQGGGGGAGGGGGGSTKRPRDLCPDLVPVEQRAPAMSPACLAKLCAGVHRDGLVAEVGAAAAAAAAGAADEDAGPGPHTRLARSPVFQAFTLRSCLNCLRAAAAATGGALSDALVGCAARRLGRQAAREAAAAGQGESAGRGGGWGGGGGGGGGAGGGGGGGGEGLEAVWRPMAQPLMLLCQTVLTTWSGTAKRPPAPRKGAGGGGGGPAAAAAAAAQRREAAAADSLAALAVSCLRELLAAAAGLGGLPAVAWVLRGLPIHSQDTQAQVDERDLPPEDIVLARLPHFSDMVSRLMMTSSFKEATSLTEVVVAVARLLPLPLQRAVSDAVWELMHQAEPQVTHTGLVRALVAAHATLRGSDELAALLTVSNYVQEVVGKAGMETQAECSAPGVLHEGTAQLAALEVLRLLQGHTGQGEELLAAVVRGASGAAEDALLAAGGAGAGTSGAAGSSGARGGGAGGGASARGVAPLMQALCRRLLEVVTVLHVVAQTRLASPQVLEAQVEVLIRMYRLLGALAKAHLPQKGNAASGAPPAPPPPLGRAFQDLVGLVHKDLTPTAYAAMGEDLQLGAAAGGGEDGAAAAAAARLSRAKLKRDAKSYSQLVHAMEEWEKQLLALERAFKAQGVNLMRGAKRSTNRDFQIMAPLGGAGGSGGGAPDRAERQRRG